MRHIKLANIEKMRSDGRIAYAADLESAGRWDGDRLMIEVDSLHSIVMKHDPNRIKGLGDIVHLAAKPIARVMDKTIGTSLSGCGSCDKRREALNRAVPLG